MFWRIIELLIVVMLVVMIGMVFTNVMLRYGFGSGIRGSEELSQLLFVWVVMLGAGYCLRERAHISASDLSDLIFPARFLVLSRAVLWVVVLIVLAAFVKGCLSQTLSNLNNISPLTGLPRALFYFAGVISGIAMFILVIREIIHNLKLFRGTGEMSQ